MNAMEAQEILARQIRELKRLAYSEWRAWALERRIETIEIVGSSGAPYQIEIEARWDDESTGNIHVFAAIDEGGWRSLAPLGADFIIAADGSFVGE